ncbi:MAG TPA: DUF3471 domain-containing protein, partial [Bellilinea sp.]|nr:DUF3471 domain-containing protein [Bellilinea sp.]
NAFEAWGRMGSPQQPTPEQVAELQRASDLALLSSPEWVKPEGGKLTLYPAGHPHLTGPLEHWHADTFLCTWSNPSYEESFVHFQVGMDGKAERLRLKVGDFIDLLTYEFTRVA